MADMEHTALNDLRFAPGLPAPHEVRQAGGMTGWLTLY